MLNYAFAVQPKFWPERPAVPETMKNQAEASLDTLFDEYNTLIGTEKEYVVLD